MPVKTTPFDPVDYLDSPETMAFYLQDAIESGDAGEIADAIDVVSRARERLLKHIDPSCADSERSVAIVQWPEVLKFQSALSALGLSLSIQPVAA